ncbi:hypothetical protein ACFOWM_05240 [Ferruginibacter yonginensis]|uniref:Uncharacterized protein n=1 Tax=Ferruginibacter yonginensis TaxID=1310416 RepID=A0ABV8QRH1_9BACT
MKIVTDYPLYQSISFWICVGLFLYFTGNFFYILFVNNNTDKVFLTQMRLIFFVVNTIKDLIISFALLATEYIDKETNELKVPDNISLDDNIYQNYSTNA